jgi:hypothetical protein
MQSHQFSLTDRQWDRRGEVVAASDQDINDRGVTWKIAERSELRTIYRADTEIDGVWLKVRVGTPQNGTWVVNAVIERERKLGGTGAALIPNLFPGDSVDGRRHRGRFQSREAAEDACQELFENITHKQMLRQLITGLATRTEGVDRRDLASVRALCAPGLHRVRSEDKVATPCNRAD